jgi:two-component system, NarL family, sensor histidine kinase DegS
MLVNFNSDSKLSINRFKRLGTWYVLALSAIASVVIVGQVLIQRHLQGQLNDSRVVNVAGKQRMLSQKISKTVLMLNDSQTLDVRKDILEDLGSSVRLWKISHDGLQHGNDSLQLPANKNERVGKLFVHVNNDFDEMHRSAARICSALSNNFSISVDSLKIEINNILQHENNFLVGMEAIVKEYENEAHEKVSTLSTMEYVLLGISLVVILLEILFIFRPTASQVNATMSKLVDSEKNAMKLSKEIGALYASLEKSYEQISIVNQPNDNPRLYAKSDRGGNVVFISDLFLDLSGITNKTNGMRVCDLFQGMENVDDWMDEVIGVVSEGSVWQGEINFKKEGQTNCWLDITLTPVFNGHEEVDELLVMGVDISSRKSAEQNMNKKNRADVEKKINQQKFRSVLILEGQEEERKRIAMDVHDGIGQMLTSLKYQIESIDLDDVNRAKQKISEVDEQIKQVIKEVRRITFNLKPTVLGDFGLQAALQVFITEIGKLTDIELVYKTKGEIERLPQKTENNIFRIIQEAINNAIKYSGADKIEVEMAKEGNDLVITVSDEGKGFDMKLVEARSTNIESGRGFFNMYERTEYVNGKLDIESGVGKGTRVVLRVTP